jgi:hypothetical protein
MKMKIVIILLALTFRAYAPEHRSLVIMENAPIQPYQAVWEAVCYVESRHNAYAIGDLNLKHWSYGIAQIRQSRLDDYNRQSGNHFTLTDMYSIEKSKQVFMFYASQYRPDQVETISRCWNGGDRGMQKSSTKPYYLKIKNAL